MVGDRQEGVVGGRAEIVPWQRPPFPDWHNKAVMIIPIKTIIKIITEIIVQIIMQIHHHHHRHPPPIDALPIRISVLLLLQLAAAAAAAVEGVDFMIPHLLVRVDAHPDVAVDVPVLAVDVEMIE